MQVGIDDVIVTKVEVVVEPAATYAVVATVQITTSVAASGLRKHRSHLRSLSSGVCAHGYFLSTLSLN